VSQSISSPTIPDQLQTINHRLQVALEQVEEAVVMIEGAPLEAPGPRIIYCNRAVARLTGRRPEEILGRPFTEFVTGDKVAAVFARLPVVLETGKIYKTSGEVRCAKGEQKTCRWTVSGARSASGEPLHFTFTFRAETSPERALSPSLTPDTARPGVGGLEIQGKAESLAFIASGIAHDFNNVLTPIIANLSLAQLDTEPGSALRARVEGAKQAADEARSLARQILDFAQGRQTRKEPGDVGKILREAACLATTGANVRCQPEIEGDLWPAEIDSAQVMQVLHNLLINARQAMPDGGIVRAVTRNVYNPEGDDGIDGLAPGDYLEVRVRDYGCGIPAENLENIFLAFFSTKKEGTGIGLATCRSIVRDHGGEIYVRSRPGTGSEFRVYLPASPSASLTTEKPARAEEIIGGHGSVLVVDDQDGIRKVACAIIGKLGYEALSAGGGEEAVDIYRGRQNEGRPVSVVLLDMTLPGGMSGSDTLAALLKIDPGVCTVATSGYFDEDALENFREEGFVSILPKPYTVEHLSKAIHEALCFVS